METLEIVAATLHLVAGVVSTLAAVLHLRLAVQRRI